MAEVVSCYQELRERIAPIVERLFQGNSLYVVRLKQREMVQMLVELFAKFTPEEMRKIKDHDLQERIDSILVLEAVSGTLNDLTPEEIAIFDAAVAGK